MNQNFNQCLNCGINTNNPKYCSRSCAAINTNKSHPKRRLTKICNECDKIVYSYRHSKCEEHYNIYIQNKRSNFLNTPLKEYWQKDSIKHLHPSSKNAHIRGLARSMNKDIIKLPCAKCGYDKHVEICHIKPIRDFNEESTIAEVNSKENIIQLCPNCHWEFDNNLLTL